MNESPSVKRDQIDWSALLLPGKTAFRCYWKLIVAIQICAVVVLILYYTWTLFRQSCDWLAEINNRGGLFAAAVGPLISSGIFPEILKWKFRPSNLPKPTWSEIIHQCLLFPLLGVLVSIFYRFQATLFGTDNSIQTLATKIAVDQLLFSPLIAIPVIVIWFLWREKGYNPFATLRACSIKLYFRRCLPIYATGLTYWPVMLIFIYGLPSALQFPLFIFANAAWSLLMVFIARRQLES